MLTVLLRCTAHSRYLNYKPTCSKSFAGTRKSFGSILRILTGTWLFWIIHTLRPFSFCLVSYLSSARLVLDVVNGPDLGADVLKVRCRGVDGARGSRSTGHWRLLLHWGLLGHGGFGDDPAAVGGAGFTVSGGSRGSGSGGGGRPRTGYSESKKQ